MRRTANDASGSLHRLHRAQHLSLEFERTGRFSELVEALDLARSVPVGEGLEAEERAERTAGCWSRCTRRRRS